MSRFLSVLMITATGLLAACGNGGSDDASDLFAAAESSLSVEGLEYQRHPDGSRVLTGILANPTSRHIRNAQVQVALYDELNQGIGSLLIVVQDIEPDSEKEFRQTVDRDDVAGARVRTIMAR